MKNVIIKIPLIVILLIALGQPLKAQTRHFNLQELLKQGQIITVPQHETKIQEDKKTGAITTKGINWIKSIEFTDGTVDIDLRGKNVFLQSFLGIAFRGTDTTRCDIVYFRPFNFQHADTTRHIL